jgi:hypothetical protein
MDNKTIVICKPPLETYGNNDLEINSTNALLILSPMVMVNQLSDCETPRKNCHRNRLRNSFEISFDGGFGKSKKKKSFLTSVSIDCLETQEPQVPHTGIFLLISKFTPA